MFTEIKLEEILGIAACSYYSRHDIKEVILVALTSHVTQVNVYYSLVLSAVFPGCEELK